MDLVERATSISTIEILKAFPAAVRVINYWNFDICRSILCLHQLREKVSSAMDNIYENATLNISVDAAPDLTIGLDRTMSLSGTKVGTLS